MFNNFIIKTLNYINNFVLFKVQVILFIQSLFIILKYQSSIVKLLLLIKLIELKNFADLLSTIVNDEKNFKVFIKISLN